MPYSNTSVQLGLLFNPIKQNMPNPDVKCENLAIYVIKRSASSLSGPIDVISHAIQFIDPLRFLIVHRIKYALQSPLHAWEDWNSSCGSSA